MGRNYTVEPSDLGRVFDGKTEYIVPDYQRSYTWKPERVDELWNDLVGCYLDDPNSKRKEYLLGPLVLVKKTRDKYDIVDGQQRLVTLTLLLCAFRDSLQECFESISDHSDMNNALTEINDWINHGRSMIYLKNSADRKAFENIRESLSDNISRRPNAIFRNYAMLRTYADELCRKCKIDEPEHHRNGMNTLRNILNDLRYKISFVCVTIDDEDHSHQYQIFQSLNSKGQPLRQADLIKNYVLQSVDSSLRKDVSRRWDNLMREFVLTDKPSGRKMKPDDIIYDSMLSRLTKNDPEIKKLALYEAVKNQYGRQGTDVGEYIRRLEEDVGFIKALNHPLFVADMSEKLRHAFYGLRQIRAVYFKRPIIAACRQWGLGDPKTSDLADCLVKFFFVYRTICKKDIDPLKRNSKSITSQIIEGADLGTVLRTLLKHKTPSGEREYIDMREFDERFENSVFDLGDDEARYILVSLERMLQERHGGVIDGHALQIEHIFPKKPNINRWPNADELASHVNRLGNITLVDEGWSSVLQRHGFKTKAAGVRTRKKGIQTKDGTIGYSQSDLEINKQYLAYDRWTLDEISHREYQLTELAKSAWSLDHYIRMAESS